MGNTYLKDTRRREWASRKVKWEDSFYPSPLGEPISYDDLKA